MGTLRVQILTHFRVPVAWEPLKIQGFSAMEHTGLEPVHTTDKTLVNALFFLFPCQICDKISAIFSLAFSISISC